MSIKELIEQIGGRDRLERVLDRAKKYTYKPDEWHRKNLAEECDSEAIEAMARALLAVMDAQQKPVFMPKPERLDGNGYGYYLDMDDVFKALDNANIHYLTVK